MKRNLLQMFKIKLPGTNKAFLNQWPQKQNAFTLLSVMHDRKILFCLFLTFFVGTLSSPDCNTVDVHNLVHRNTRRDRSQCIRKYNRPNIHDVSFDSLLTPTHEPLGLHHLRTKLCSIPLRYLNILSQNCIKQSVIYACNYWRWWSSRYPKIH